MAKNVTFKIERNSGAIKIIDRLRKHPSYLSSVVNELAKIPYNECDGSDIIPLPFDIEDKINFNDLGEYKYLIEEYGLYKGHLDRVYSAIQDYYPAARYKILKLIFDEYRQIKGGIFKTNRDTGLSEMELIRTHSDRIIEAVKDKLDETISIAGNLDSTIHEEDIGSALKLIICDAFIECKILENPNGYKSESTSR